MARDRSGTHADRNRRHRLRVPLAAIRAVAGFIGGSLVGTTVPFVGTDRVPIVTGLVDGRPRLRDRSLGVFILAFIINALAPTFGAAEEFRQAFKVAVYSWHAGRDRRSSQIHSRCSRVLGSSPHCTGRGRLYLGLPRLMKARQDKAVAYTAVVVVCAIVLSIVVTSVGGASIAGGAAVGAIGALWLGRAAAGSSRPDSPMGSSKRSARAWRRAVPRWRQAQKRGDANAEATAAFEGLGALLGGGARVDRSSINQLTPLMPAQFAGLARKSSDSERTGMAGITVATAEAAYGDGAGRSATLEITDTGGATGLMGLAAWAEPPGRARNDQFSERTERVGGRHRPSEDVQDRRQAHEYNIVIGDRFIVNAER